MNILVDTGTWLKIDLLAIKSQFDVNQLYDWAEICITHEVEKELNHFNCTAWIKNRTAVFPIVNQAVYKEAIALKFDPADASLLSIAKPISGEVPLETYLLSEDRPLLKFAAMSNFACGLFADALMILTAVDLLSKKDLYRLIKELRQLKNISEKKTQAILKWRESS